MNQLLLGSKRDYIQGREYIPALAAAYMQRKAGQLPFGGIDGEA